MLGWREWIAIPTMGIDRIKAKVDTGARTSALHAFYIEPYTIDGKEWVRFGVHPEQQNSDLVIECKMPVKDRRSVADSGGHREERYVIEAELVIGEIAVTTEVTLTDRDTMKFRMLLGRTAMRGIFTVDPAASYLSGVITKTHRDSRESAPAEEKI
jgi:hypothetical protein